MLFKSLMMGSVVLAGVCLLEVDGRAFGGLAAVRPGEGNRTDKSKERMSVKKGCGV